MWLVVAAIDVTLVRSGEHSWQCEIGDCSKLLQGGNVNAYLGHFFGLSASPNCDLHTVCLDIVYLDLAAVHILVPDVLGSFASIVRIKVRVELV